MNSKFFVPFETAKALKKKGYNEVTDYIYANREGILHWNNYRCNNSNLLRTEHSAPTYHEVLDWLEGNDQCIQINVDMHGWYGFVYDRYKNTTVSIEGNYYKSREEALNAAILKALELI